MIVWFRIQQAEPSPLQSNEVSYVVESIKEFVNLETYDGRNESVPFTETQQNLNDGPLFISGKSNLVRLRIMVFVLASVVHFLYMSEDDVDVLIEMACIWWSIIWGNPSRRWWLGMF